MRGTHARTEGSRSRAACHSSASRSRAPWTSTSRRRSRWAAPHRPKSTPAFVRTTSGRRTGVRGARRAGEETPAGRRDAEVAGLSAVVDGGVRCSSPDKDRTKDEEATADVDGLCDENRSSRVDEAAGVGPGLDDAGRGPPSSPGEAPDPTGSFGWEATTWNSKSGESSSITLDRDRAAIAAEPGVRGGVARFA